MASGPRDFPRARPKPCSNLFSKPKELQNAKYIPGVTQLDRSKASMVPPIRGKVQDIVPSLLVGEPRCRGCYKEDDEPCECEQPLFYTDITVYWTRASRYLSMDPRVIRKCEDIAMQEARNLGMKFVVLRSKHHNTATEFTFTGRKTGNFIPADWHITLYLGEAFNRLLLQGHCNTYVGKDKSVPQCKLKSGNRTLLENHELFEKLTLAEAKPESYWGINGSAGWVNAAGVPVNENGDPIPQIVA